MSDFLCYFKEHIYDFILKNAGAYHESVVDRACYGILASFYFSYMCGAISSNERKVFLDIKYIDDFINNIKSSGLNKISECHTGYSSGGIMVDDDDDDDGKREHSGPIVLINFEKIYCVSLNIARYIDLSVVSFNIRCDGSPGSVNEFFKFIKSFDYVSDSMPENIKPYVYMLLSAPHGLSLDPLHIGSNELIKENYSDISNQKYDYIAKQFVRSEPHGRLVVISGQPGTGKTYFIRGLVSELANKLSFIFIPAKFAGEIDSPNLVSLLLDHKKNVNKSMILLIEDADLCIEARDGGNLSIISSLLNYTDGILGSLLDIRVIATTNMENIQLDKAVLRSGRLLTKFEIEKLSVADANRCLKNLNSDIVVDKPTLLSDIYALINNAERQNNTDKKNIIGFGG